MTEFVRIPHCLACLGAILVAQNCFAFADGPLAESTAPLECQIEGTPEDNFRYAAVQCWLPQNPEVRGILCVVLHPDGVNGRILQDSGPWQALAADYGYALIGISIVPSVDSTKLWFAADQGSGDALLSAISHFADLTGIESMRTACLVLVGVCAAGQFAYEFAAFQPNRTAGFVTIGGAKHRLSIASKALHVPALLVPTIDRGAEATANLQGLRLMGKCQGAAWSAMEGRIAEYDAGEIQSEVAAFLQHLLENIPKRHDINQALRLFSWGGELFLEIPPQRNVFSKRSFSFLGRPLPILVSEKNQRVETTPSPDGQLHAAIFIKATSDEAFDTVSLPLSLVKNSRVRRTTDSEWQIDLVIDTATIPSGSFTFEVPIRFTKVGKSILGGVQVPVQGTVSRDIYPVPRAIQFSWSKSINESFLHLESRSAIPITEVSIESVQPDCIEANIVQQDQGMAIIKICPKLQAKDNFRTVAGYIIVRGITDKEQRIRIPFYGTIKG